MNSAKSDKGVRKAVIVGAGPAGLTAAFELLERTSYLPIVLEASDHLGGISRTVNHKGYLIDLGGHRFFSKSDRVMDWWLDRMPLQKLEGSSANITYRRDSRVVAPSESAPDPESTDKVMLLRSRKSRIYYDRSFFDYPLQPSLDTLSKLGLLRVLKIGFSYAWALLFANKKSDNLEDFLIGRFGKELYLTFFKSYTEKIWGIECREINAEWGIQRIKGLSIGRAIRHLLKRPFRRPGSDLRQKETETSMIEQFLYPKFGPGQMWEIVAEEITDRGGQIIRNQRVTQVHCQENTILSVEAVDPRSGRANTYSGDIFFSTMPIPDLISQLTTDVPKGVLEVSRGLLYRDFITVGLLVRKLKIRDEKSPGHPLIRDNWIYIQEEAVSLGRLQIFNNWSPYMVLDNDLVWLGLEYFCSESDAIWKMADEEILALGREELTKIGIIDQEDVIEGRVLRMPKAYPAYFGTYGRFGKVRAYLDQFVNLFPLGRNGMHKYNNQDHSMLTAMVAVDNIVSGRTDKSNIWEINTEQEHHENK